MPGRVTIANWAGRLCNNIVQLCHAISYAERTHSYLSVPPHDLLQTYDIDFTTGSSSQDVLVDDFFWLNPQLFEAKYLEWNERRRILKTYIQAMLPSQLLPQTPQAGLVIHIRSGDIFQRLSAAEVFQQAQNPLRGVVRLIRGTHRVNAAFVQPPLAFYLSIIESQPWSQVTLVSEDLKNPVIQALRQAHPTIQFQLQDLEADIATLLAASHLVIGYGSFGMTWALLSEHLQSLYCPVVPAQVFGEVRPGNIEALDVHSFQFNNYISANCWRATAAQKQLMLTYDARNIVLVQ